jgi:myo-inositol 2-dehydrogenase/D-chiro-inositol 1-dehydrogenase
MKQVNVGFIGCGEFAEFHREALESIPQAKLTVVHDRDRGRAQAFAARAGAKAVGEVQELLLDSSIDAVYVLTRHDSHAELVLQAIAAGKAIFCEKPLALTAADAERVVTQVKKGGSRLMVGFNHRWSPVVRKAMEMAAHQTSEPSTLHLSFVTAPFLNGWGGLEEEGGGVFHCLGSHAIDLASYLLGRKFTRVEAIQARLRLPDPYLPDTASVLLQAEDGAMASLLLHDHAPESYIRYETGENSHLVRADLFGNGWAITVDSLSHLTLYNAQGRHDVYVESNSRVERFGILAEDDYFIKCLLGGSRPEPNESDGARAVALVEMAAASARGRLAASVGTL